MFFTGEWKLWVQTTVPCLLEEFKGDFRLLLNSSNPDCDGDGLLDGQELNASYDGWVTNPADADSDGDGWNDWYEIYVMQTNPLAKDTDGDKGNDPDDRDPFYNLMLKVRVLEGHECRIKRD